MSRALTMMMNPGSVPSVQPEYDSVAGSPFAVSLTAVPVPDLSHPGVMIYATNPIHFRVSTDASSADTNDMILQAGVNHVIPLDRGQSISMIRVGATDATVYIEKIKLGA